MIDKLQNDEEKETNELMQVSSSDKNQHQFQDLQSERRHKIEETFINHEPKTEDEKIIAQMINPLLSLEACSSSQFQGIHLKTVDTKYLKIIIEILSWLDRNEDLDMLDIFSVSPIQNLSFSELYCLLCNAEYLGMPAKVLFNIVKKWMNHESFITYDLVKEYFLASIPESLSPLSLYMPANFIMISYLWGWLGEDEDILSKDYSDDLIKYLYIEYSKKRVSDREKLRAKSYFLFDDQLNYLQVKYHPIFEEEEENKLEQLEVVREENK